MDYDDDHVDYGIEGMHNLVGKDVVDVCMIQFYNVQGHNESLNNERSC